VNINNMLEKMEHLNVVRIEIGEEAFRINAATIITKYYTDWLKVRGIKRNRMSILNHVNLKLLGLDVDKVSYGFIRKFY